MNFFVRTVTDESLILAYAAHVEVAHVEAARVEAAHVEAAHV